MSGDSSLEEMFSGRQRATLAAIALSDFVQIHDVSERLLTLLIQSGEVQLRAFSWPARKLSDFKNLRCAIPREARLVAFA